MALLSGLAAFAWLVIIVLLHFIKPELRPAEHMVSEYARKPKGWVMLIAFFSMAISCFALTSALWPLASHIGVLLLVVVGIGFVGLGTFVTDPVILTKDATHTRSGNLHNIFGAIVIPLFPIMATAVGVSIQQNAAWFALTWLGFIGFVGSMIHTATHPQKLVFGYFQRFMILTYTVWLMVAALVLVVAA